MKLGILQSTSPALPALCVSLRIAISHGLVSFPTQTRKGAAGDSMLIAPASL